MTEHAADRIRLDRWLWATRLYKTRALAVEAIEGGKIQVNGKRAKRAKLIAVGDVLRIRKPPYEQTVVVHGLSQRRGSARETQALYQETPESRSGREQLRAQLRVQPAVTYEGRGRPTKRDRRAIERFKRGR